MQALKLRKIGNSFGLIFPKEILGQIGIGEGDSLFLVETPEGAFRQKEVTPPISWVPVNPNITIQNISQVKLLEKSLRKNIKV